MPPGSSNFEKIGPPTLRSSAPVRRQTRSVYAQLPVTSPKKTMESLKLSPRKRRSGGEQSRSRRNTTQEKAQEKPQEKPEEKPREVSPDELADCIAPLAVSTEETDPASSSGASSSSSYTPGGPVEVPGERPGLRRGRRIVHTGQVSEFYSRRIYRGVLNGDDLDVDKDEPDIPECSRQATIVDSWRPEYCSGTQELAHPEAIPKMEVLDDDFVLKAKPTFELPERLVCCDIGQIYVEDRFFERIEPRDPVHYEVTAHDVTWLKRINEKRQLVSGQPYLPLETFCKIIKALEIDAFQNIHNHLLDSLHVVYPPYRDAQDQENAECDICRLKDFDASEDAMVFCDMCNTCVHISCSGLQSIPPGKYKCPKCKHTGEPAHPCHLCPALGGSMTHTQDRSVWAHHSCSLFVPEILFADEDRRAPIYNFEAIAPERWQQLCTICDTRQGACVTCSHPECEETYHVCCALRAGCKLELQEIPSDPACNVLRLTYCQRHSNARDIIIEDRYRSAKNPWLAKIEQYFFVMTNYEKLAESLNIEEIIISDVYEYWKQKRMRRGGALIPHLHDHVRIEPTIERVAQNQAGNLNSLLHSAGISIGTLAGVDLTRNHFFRPAALMVTELRIIDLKRAGEAIRRDTSYIESIERREKLKKDLVEEERHILKMTNSLLESLVESGKSSEEALKTSGISRWEIKKAQNPKAFEELLRKIEGVKLREDVRPARKAPQKTANPSPLRPRNHHHHGHPPGVTVTRNINDTPSTSSGTQNSRPIPIRRKTPAASRMHY